MAKDPVCGMQVDNSNHTSRHNGQDICFCSPGCKDEFDRAPERFSSASGPNPEGNGPQGQRSESPHPIGQSTLPSSDQPGGESGLGGTGSSPHGVGPLDQRQGEGFRQQPGMGDRRGGMIADLPVGHQKKDEGQTGEGVAKKAAGRTRQPKGGEKKYGT